MAIRPLWAVVVVLALCQAGCCCWHRHHCCYRGCEPAGPVLVPPPAR